jgi:hypothetical protein
MRSFSSREGLPTVTSGRGTRELILFFRSGRRGGKLHNRRSIPFRLALLSGPAILGDVTYAMVLLAALDPDIVIAGVAVDVLAECA